MAATAGSIRFNTDSAKMEIYNGEKWWEIDSTSPEVQTGGTRGIIAGASPYSAVIDYFNISSTGDAEDFGDLNNATEFPSSGNGASRTRGIIAGGRHPGNSYTNVIDYIKIATAGDAVDFGDLATPQGEGAGCSTAHGGL